MKSRYWFILSVMLFIAAAFFWRLGEDRRALQHAAKQKISTSTETKAPVTRPAVVPVSSTGSSKRLLTDLSTNSVTASSTNAPEPYPHRLKNTSQSMEQLVQNDRAILLRNALIDTGGEGVKIPDELRSKGNPGSYIVQARGVIDATFRAALIEARAEIVSYVPNNAYLVRLPNGAGKLAGNKQVQSVLPYEPYYKLDTELLAMAVEKKPLTPTQIVRVGLFPGQRDSAVAVLGKSKAQIIGEDLNSSPFGPELIVASADLIQLANMSQVQEIEPYYEREMLNDLTRERLGVSTNTVTPANFLDLTGSNVWVNVNDTTIDNTHPDLSPRIFPAAGVGVVDFDGHGTHVAGIIASSGVNGPGESVTNVGSVLGANFRGKAPASSILSLEIFSGLSDAALQRIAAETNYLALNRLSPLISNNSWGYGTRTYNSSAASFDAAVRDAIPGTIGSQPVAYVFAAGNSGGGGVPGTVTSPGTAKNVISVGALESKRNITNDVVRPNANCTIVTNKEFLGLTDSSNQVASFSSRGNVGIAQEGAFGRLKPDVVAPGTFIASTRSQQFDEASYYSPLHQDRNTFPNLVLDPLATNNFAIFIPDNPCDEGTTLSLTIEAIITSPVPTNTSLQIYAATTPNPSSVPGNLIGVDSVTIPRPSLPLGDVLYYDIVSTNDLEIIYTLQTTLVLSNDFGQTTNGFFQVLSNLNSQLAPNYMFESGTSMSAPAISGMLALMQEFFEQRFQITNSPAMMKALLINGSRSVGSGYNKEATLNDAGWGLPDLQRILPTNSDAATWPIQLFDQNTNFSLATGDRHDRVVTMNDLSSPLRITLVWTDPAGNPAVGVKLVNDLDLVVTTVVTNGLDTNNQPIVSTNVYFGNNFPGGEFTQASVLGTNGLGELEAARDSVNNVENVYINGPLSGQFTVSVVGRRVNVNAVTAHTNGIVQDYALVISADTGTNAPFTVDTNNIVALPNPNAFVTFVTNGAPLFKQRVGANSPLINVNSNNLTDGTTNQWAFYVLNNPSNFQNIAFLTFLPPNLSGASNNVPGSRRIVEADLDLYVSTDPTLTNLNPVAIAGADKSRKRGGQELIVYTNRSDPVFYVGIKSEDQRASEFSFFAIASATPFSEENNGNLIVYGIPAGGVDVPDGSPDNPGGTPYIMIAATDMKVGRLIVTNSINHERIGDLIETLTHEGSAGEISAVLLNHSFPDGIESGPFTAVYDDSGLEDDLASTNRPTDGPGSLLDFVGEQAAGAWIVNLEDNSLNSTGRIEAVSMFIERALDTNEFVGGNGFSFSGGIPPGQSRALSFVVPANVTNMIISVSPKEGALDTVIRRGRLAPTRTPYVDKGTNIAPPGASFNVDGSDVPPLKPGRYVLRLFNDNGVFVNFSGLIEFQLNFTAASVQTYSSSGLSTVIDDAVANSIIHVDRDERVVSTEVSVRIDHPRVSDLVLHLVSPQGTRVLLAENRGGFSTNGYGFSDLQTNVFPTTTAGSDLEDVQTFGPVLTSGFININYDFFDAPDRLRIYYDGLRIFDSGLINGSGQFSVPYGPGSDTNIIVVMNEGGSTLMTQWEYTATVLSGDFVYATFSENTNLALIPIKFAIPPFATNLPGSNLTANALIQNGSFEADLAGWNANNAGIVISPYVPTTIPASDGTKAVEIGINDISGSILDQPFTAEAGASYLLSFDILALGDPGRTSVLRVDLTNAAGTLVSQTFTNAARNTPPLVYETKFIRFTAPQTDTNLTLRFVDISPGGGVAVDAIVDNIQLPSLHGDPNYFLPEESLKTLIGENAMGDWKLEIWDSRAGAPFGALQLLSWQLHLTFASTLATATPLSSGTTSTNTVTGSEFQYFFIDVPIFATQATNILTSLTGGALNLWFNQEELPVGNPSLGDVALLSSTLNGTRILTPNTLPSLQPGQRYYLGVQNANASLTNTFSLTVTFDNTNNLVQVIPLTNNIPLTTNIPLSQSIQYYQYDLLNSVSAIEFRLFNLSADADLVVRRDQLPTQTTYDFFSNLGGTSDEVITVASPAPGRYYLGVYGFFPANDITYTIMVTEGPAPFAPMFSGKPTLSASGFHVTANTVIGRRYELDVSLDLVNWMEISTITATANVTTFNDPTPTESQPARFYRLKLLP